MKIKTYLNQIQRATCMNAKLLSLLVVALLSLNIANGQLVNVPLTTTSYNNDIVADGIGATNTVSTGKIPGVTHTTVCIDGNSSAVTGLSAYSFVDNTYKWYSGSAAFPTCGIPSSIASTKTAGLTYILKSASVNNSLTIASNTYVGDTVLIPTSGTFTLATPASYGQLFVLYETVLNTGTPTINATITFTDATTQVISSNVVKNWFDNTGGNVAYSNMQRAQNAAPGTPSGCGSGPYLFEMPLTILPANYSKLVSSVTLSWSAPTGSSINTLDYFHAMALGGNIPCSGTPTPGNTIASSNPICSGVSFTLSTQNSTGLGATYQWQTSSDGTNYSNVVSGGTSATLSASQTAATYYQCQVTCSGSTATSTALQVTMSAPNTCYCINTNTTNTAYYINNFSTTGGTQNITNNGSGFSSSGYGNFTGMTVQQLQGSSVNFSITGAGSTYGFGIWVDWNQNGSFADAGEQMYLPGTYLASATGSFTVPLTATPGSTRMRVVENYLSTSPTACTGTAYTECEDYTFNVVLLLPCAVPAFQPTAPSLSVVSTSQINGTFTAATGAPSGYLVVRYPTGAAVTNPVDATTYVAGSLLGLGTVVQSSSATTFTSTGLSGATTYDYYVYAYNNTLCGAGPKYLTTGSFFGTMTTLPCGTMSGVIPIGPTAPASPTGFPTLTAAIAYITTNGLGGATILELQSDYLGASETFPITFPVNPCVGSLKPLTVRPAAGATNLVITSSNAGPTFDFNGCTYVTIDGRPGGTGSVLPYPNAGYLIVQNSNAGGVAIRMINDAQNNTIMNCEVIGQNTASGALPGAMAGIIFIGNTTGISGNDNNTITNNTIRSNSPSFATMGIYSFGPAGSSTLTPAFNDNNFITNNNIVDIYGGVNLSTAAIELEKGTNAWTITGNSIFQTTNRTPVLTASVINRGIYIATTNSSGVGNGFTITGNYIGGMAPQCGGSTYSSAATGSFNNQFDGIDVSVASGSTTNIKTNTIANLNISQAASTGDIMRAIAIGNNGNVNVGGPLASDGNIVGSSTIASSIVLTSTSQAPSHMILVSGGIVSTNILVQNNKIGGVRTAGTGTSLTGIFCNSSATITIDKNLIGSTTVVNSFEASGNTTTAQFVNGIRFPSGSATATITNNTISDLNNNSTSTTSVTGNSTSISPQTGGIIITGSTTTVIVNSISGNIIRNLSNAAPSPSNLQSAALVGIGTNSTASTAMTISNNIIDSLFSTAATGSVLMEAISYYSSTSNSNIINGNFIHSLGVNSASTTASIRGIELATGSATVTNNMIRLGYIASGASLTNPITIYGILNSDVSQNFYHNSVYIGGTGVLAGASNTFAFWRGSTTSADIRDNIFVNARAGAGAGKHYSFYCNAAGGFTNVMTLNYNVYNSTPFAFNGAADVATYSIGWFGGDVNSWSLNPQFVNPTGSALTVDLHINPALTTPVESTGVNIPSVTLDFDGQNRSGLTPVDIGADAGIFTSLPPCAAPNTPAGVITLTPISGTQINGSFNPSVPAAETYVVVQYFAGATPTLPVNGTIYSVGNVLGAGTVISVGTSTTFSATNLFGGTAYDFYVYPANVSCVGTSPFYNTLFPFATASTTACAGISGTFPVGPTAPVPPSGFPFLKTALAYLTANGMSGNVILELQSDYLSVGDTVIIGNIPCLGPLKQLTIRPATGANGLSITTAHSIASVDINGGSFVTIDGRPGGTGAYVAGTNLLIKNTIATAPAIRLINDARFNTIKYCDLQSNNSGATASATGGVVLISTTTGANGNDNNTIDNCDIHNITGGNPIMGINGLGTTTTALQNNDNNTISNCNIYDYFNATVGTGGIYIGSGNGSWTITNNHFYQTVLRIPTGTATYRDIYINNATASATGSGFVITNNYFGGNDNLGNGLYNMIGASAYLYNSMTIGVGIGTATSIQNNIFRNINMSSISTSAAAMSCIQVAAGVVNIGTVTGNVIGAANTDASITPAITYTNTSTSNGGFIPIFAATPTTCTISNNTIAGIQIVGNATLAPAEFNGIGYNSGTITINNNTIGSLTTAKSIYCATTSATATAASRFVGILISLTGASGGITINGNTIANMYTNFAATTAPTTSGAKGIFFTGTYTNSTNIAVTNNTIRDITTFAQTTSSGAASALQGIALTTAGAFGTYNVSGNTIFNLNLAGASTTNAVQTAGIYVSSTPAGASSISKNFIHSINLVTANPNVVVTGIEAGAGAFTYSNNTIRLGINGAGNSVTSPSVFRGIAKTTTTNNNFYFNTVYVGGTGVGASTSLTYGFLRTATGTDIVRNNIFVNNRSNAVVGGANHFAIGLTSGTTTLTSNNNDFYTNGVDGILGFISPSTACPTITAWQTTSTQDVSSYNDDPLLNNPTGDATTLNLHINSGLIATNLESQAVTVAGISTDIDNDVRPGPAGSVNGGGTAPDIGADEFDGIPKLPPAIPANPTQAAGSPACLVGSVLTATGTAPSGVVWYWQTSSTGTDQSNNASSPLTVYANGSYYIRAYSTVSLLWSLGSGSVTVSNFPAGPSTPPAPVALNNPACGSGTTISVTAAPGGQTYYWQPSANSTSNLQNANVILPVTTAGTYYVRAIDNTTGCWSNTNSVLVNFLAPLTGTFTTTNIVACGGTASINIAANGSATVFNNTFSSPALNAGQAVLSGNASITGGQLVITPALSGQTGTIRINNLTGLASNDFQVDFDFITQSGGASSTPFAPFTAADGLSYSYADDATTTFINNTNGTATIGVPSGLAQGNTAEGGSGTKLKLSFDPFANGAGLPANGNNDAGIYFMYNCTEQFNTPLIQNGVLDYSNVTWWRATSAQPITPVNTTHVTIIMAGASLAYPNGSATLTLTGTTGLATGQSYTKTVGLPASYLTANKTTWYHVFAARTGGNWEGHYIDNMSVQYSNIYEYSIDNGATWSLNQNFTNLNPGNYTVLVRYASLPNCITNLGTTTITGPPAAYTTNSTDNPICSSVAFTASITPAPIFGSSFQWESSLDGTNWTPIPSATSSSYTEAAGITAPKYYHCLVTCGASTITSSPLFMTINSFLNCYCISSATAIADEDIVNVTIGTLNNTSNCASTGGPGSVLNLYSNYSALPAPNVQQASPTSFSVGVGSCGSTTTSNKTAIFIDFNHDGSFTGQGENVYVSSAATVGPHIETGSINIPISALVGNTKMRVITVQTTGTISPCGTYTSGETEDYTINITPAPVCSGNPFAGTLPSSVTVCIGTSASLSSTGYTNNTSGITFQWLESDDNGLSDPWTAVTTGTNGFSTVYNTNFTSALLTNSIYYRLLATCINGGGTDTTAAEFVQVINPQVTSVTNGTHCGAGSVTICATGSFGTALSWYTVPSGGSPLSLPYNAIPVTGFNNDIVASGIGSNSISGITYPGIGVDGANYYFMDNTYKYVSTNPFPTCFMPTNNLAPSSQTPGLTYQLQSYTANNALSIANQSSAYTSPLPSSGTLTLTTPASYGTLKVLYETVSNIPTTGFTVDALVTFTDATTQSFPANNCVNWFTTTAPAYSGMGRGTPSGAYECSTTVPNMFELSLALNAGNYAKQVQSITFSIPTVLTGAFPYSVNYFHAMAVGGSAPLSGNCFTTPVLNATTLYYVQASAAGCTSPRVVDSAIVTPAPAITVSPNTSICQSDSILLTVSSIANDPNYKYTWNPGGLVGASVKVAPNISTTYTVTALDTTGGSKAGCIITGTVTITVNQRPTITALTSSPAVLCQGDTAQISLTAVPYIPPSGNYSVTSIPFAPYVPITTTLTNAGPTGDEGTVTGAALGFNFNFYGTTYSTVTVHTDGYIVFDPPAYVFGSFSPPTIPSTANTNSWAGFWADLNAVAGNISYQTFGVAPFRKFVVNYNAESYFSATPSISEQIVLNETYNTIEVHMGHAQTTNTQAIGCENQTGLLGTAAPGRNSGTWSTDNESWLFAAPVVSGLTYSWSPATALSSTSISNPKAAPNANSVYTVTVNESGTGCSRTASIALNVTPKPVPNVTPGNDTIVCSSSLGYYIHVKDVGPYALSGYPIGTMFEWVNYTPPTVGLDSIFVNISDNYTCIVYLPGNLGGCSKQSDTVFVDFGTAQSPLPYMQQDSVKCFGNNNGKAIAELVSGNVPSINYKWYNSANVLVRNVTNNIGSDTLKNVPKGWYYLHVNNGISSPQISCLAIDSIEVLQPDLLTANTGEIIHNTCFGAASGSIQIIANGGTPDYSYLWNGGATTQNRTGLIAGTYTVTVTDVNGCSTSVSATITQPTVIIPATTQSNVSCKGGSDGSITLTVSGGVPNYTFLWTGGATTQNLTGKTAGIYTVIVTDANGCTKTISATITEPTVLNASTTQTNVNCNGESNGSINVTPTGGSPGYTYLWNDASVSQNRTGLAAGIYTVTITDTHGCTKTVSTTVTQPAALAIGSTITNVACYNTSTGSIQLAPTGGTSPYSYLWNNGATSQNRNNIKNGVYYVTVTDQHGCSLTASYTVTQPNKLLINLNVTTVKCGGGNNGKVTANPIGGTTPYVYLWSNGQSSNVISNLTAGTYTVTVTDAKLCVSSTSIVVTQNPPLVVIVAPGPGNSATANVSGGIGPYVYLWNTVPPQTTANATGLSPCATYKVKVTDSKNCSKLSSVTIPCPKESVGDVTVELMVTVYPNPTTGMITIHAINFETQKVIVKVFDGIGQMVFDKQLALENNSTVIDLGDLPKGIYMLNVMNGDKFKTIKIVLQ